MFSNWNFILWFLYQKNKIILGSRISIKEDLEPDDKIVDDLLKKIKSRTKFILEKSQKDLILASNIASEMALDGLK